GASVGQKINPFYKTVAMHNGIDLLGATGTDILASANGVVEQISRKGKKEGNTITINHGNGYVTKYMQVGDILARQGQRVVQGMVIGRIGLSGISFAPHLHYEIVYNGKNMDPVNYFFADLTPALFKEMVAITANTGQSLD
ncbi:MAG: M23 family metallopeptidase, partial [Bacteroidales bacterium]